MVTREHQELGDMGISEHGNYGTRELVNMVTREQGN